MPPLRSSGAGPEAEHPEYAGKYRLEAQLGSGGMGVVHLARSASGLRLAVKVVHAEFAQDPEFRGRFRQEVAAARRVSGAFTAPVVDADTGGERPWMATLYIPGPTLSEHVKRNGPLPPAEVRRLAAGLAEALHDIHRAGVVHRDLKPGNVLLAADGPKVIDFGISRPSDSEMRTETGKLIGTPPFMAPEQFQRPREVGPAADVFALGSVLVHAATGSGPFDSESPYLVAYQVVHDEADLAGVPPELVGLISGCLAKDPELRPTPAALMELLRTDAGPPQSSSAGATALATDPRVPAQRPAGEAERQVQDTHVRSAPRGGAAAPAGPAPRSAGNAPDAPAEAAPGPPAPPASQPSADAPARRPRGRRRTWPAWATWTALAAVLAGAGTYMGVRVLAQEKTPALQTRSAAADGAFHSWQTPLLKRPAGHPAEMPFCAYGAQEAEGALFCVQRGVLAARVDARTGAVDWRRAAGPEGTTDLPPRAPVLSGGLLYVLSPDSRRLDALDPSAAGKGATRWSKDVSAYRGRVRVVGDRVLLVSADGTVTALDSRTHRPRWHRKFPGHPQPRFVSYAPGGQAPDGGKGRAEGGISDHNTAYAAQLSLDGTSTRVTAIDPRSGTVRWSEQLPGQLMPVGTGSSGAAYLAAADRQLSTRTAAVVRYDPSTRRSRSLPLAAPMESAQISVRGETAYVLGFGGALQAVGERRWQVETSVSRGSAPVTTEGDRLYFTAADGRLLAVDTRRGALLGQTVPRIATGRTGYLESLPAPLADPGRGRVHAAAPNGTVFAVEAEDPARW